MFLEVLAGGVFLGVLLTGRVVLGALGVPVTPPMLSAGVTGGVLAGGGVVGKHCRATTASGQLLVLNAMSTDVASATRKNRLRWRHPLQKAAHTAGHVSLPSEQQRLVRQQGPEPQPDHCLKQPPGSRPLQCRQQQAVLSSRLVV